MERLACVSCGYEFAAQGQGQVICPNCGSVVVERREPAPESGSEEPTEGKPAAEPESGESPPQDAAGSGSPAGLSLREEGIGIQPGKVCPCCGRQLAADATLCVNCGYDFRTSRMVSQPAGRPFLGRAAVFFMAGLVVGAAAGFLLGRSPLKRSTAREPGMVAVDASQPNIRGAPGDKALVAASGSAEASPGEPTDMGQEVSEEEAAAAAGAEAPPSSELSAEERKRFRERIEQRLTKWLEERYPPFQKDEEAGLRLRSGIVYRGRFLGVKGDVVVIVRGGRPLEIPLADLDRPSRLRSDTSFRRKYLEYAVKRYEQRLSQRGKKGSGK